MLQSFIKPLFIRSKIIKNFTSSLKRNYCIPPPRKMSPIVWIDMEMTGLDIDKDRIMEIACIITDNHLNVIAEGPTIIINQPDNLLESMNDWCKKTHKNTGLLDDCRQSTVTEDMAENVILNFVKQHTGPRDSPLAGNSVYMDRLFLIKYMPTLNSYLHYRIIDVSTVKELTKRWNSKVFSRAPSKKLIHRGLDDIRESIEEMKYYKKYMFNQ